MEEEIEYKKLYDLQDRIMPIVFGLENGFYLTGGTALHRFYYNLRYSDDLDFFSSNDLLFGESVREVYDVLENNGIVFSKIVDAKDFRRIVAEGCLQLDFVNDRVYREGKSNIVRGMRIDNVVNILTNKLAAIMDRDEEKDIFDLFAISGNEQFHWGKMLEVANKKAVIKRDFLIERLKSFPLEWLSNIKAIKRINISSDAVDAMCRDVLLETDNSLYGDARIIS